MKGTYCVQHERTHCVQHEGDTQVELVMEVLAYNLYMYCANRVHIIYYCFFV